MARLRDAEQFQAQGATIPQVCKKRGVSEQTFYRWRTNSYQSFQRSTTLLWRLAVTNDRVQYVPCEPELLRSPKLLPRAEARQMYSRTMATKLERIEHLRLLVAADGVGLGTDDASIQALNDWFVIHLEADPEVPGELLPIWHSIVRDIGLFLGEVMIERHPQLRWEFFTWGKRNVAYQRPVIIGFSTEDPKLRTEEDPRQGGDDLRLQDR